ncbi:protein-glutamine gamma-glutamyltransferase [Paenibacillus thalictri]|uniref:Protein-glutamine gamma-glutamyltransferase n=1 Tax=Paenibacillus thalictri TaxID=2527873 RepID=A0A4Q9DPM7_9BACL|nr:protein-glutamine gamma-glutamyltransferase [Paenibacillus thalictri]
MDELLFELKLRGRIVDGARQLSASGAKFANFTKSKANEDFWKVTDFGGFMLKDGITPHEALNDIFTNGKKYAFECATAISIVLYKAVLDTIGPKQFDTLFADLLLYDWHLNNNLRLLDRSTKETAAPGDVLYFENSDFSPKTPWWRGENVVLLDDGKYYGHGIGIRDAQGMIDELNKFRVKDSKQSAYLDDRYKQLDFDYYRQFRLQTGQSHIRAVIGGRQYVIRM